MSSLNWIWLQRTPQQHQGDQYNYSMYYTIIRNRTSGLLSSGTWKNCFKTQPSLQHYYLAMLSSATLGLVGMERNLFIAVQVLWPSQSLKHNVLAISKQTLHSIKGFSLSLSDPLSTQQIRCGWTIGREGTKLGQLTPTDLRDIPHRTMCHAQH